MICGVSAATTRDHVPPKGLFKGLSVPLITVPACAPCNNGASSDDEDLRFFIGAQVGKHSAEAAKVWELGARKSLRRKTSLRQHVLSTTHEVGVPDAGGQIVSRLAITAPVAVYESVFGRTTRGLYFFHTGRVLDPEVKITAEPLNVAPDSEFFDGMVYHEIGGNVCRYWYSIASDEINSCIWLYCFHQSHWVYVATGAACELDDA